VTVGQPQFIRPLTLKHVENEEPVGDIDSVNVNFTTRYRFESASLKVYLNGLRLSSGLSNDYVVNTSNSFSLNYAPTTGDVLIVDYLRTNTN
jgi:hypothetical protein